REAQDRVAGPPGVELFGRTEVGLGRGRVGRDPVALGLDQGRTLSGARTGNRLGRDYADAEDVVAVCDNAGNPVSGGAVGDVGDTRRSRRGSRDRPLVVLADEHDRGREDGAEVTGLVKDPLVRGAVAEEAEHHTLATLEPQPVRGADRDSG